MNSTSANSFGFTLLELIIALAITAIVSTVGVPAMSDWLGNQRVRAESRLLWQHLGLARQTAVLRRQVVVACPTLDGLRCDDALDWSQGWMMFINLDDDRPAQKDPNERLISRHQSHDRIRIVSNRRTLRFSGDLQRASNGRLLVCGDRAGQSPTQLVISPTGRTRLVTGDTNTGGLACP
ncbi:MAG: GspH/FimT family pseudopilin [Pseudomonadota bacterium]